MSPTDAAALSLTAGLASTAVAAAPAALVGIGAISGARAWRRARPGTAWPLALALAAGLALATAAVADGPIAGVLAPRWIFGAGGPWDLTGAALVAERYPAALAGLGRVLRTPPPALPPAVAWLVRAFLAGTAAAVLLPFFGLPLRAAARTALAALAVEAVAVAGLLYLACFGPWLLNLLNFWFLGLAFLAYCYWRHGTL